MSSTTPKWDKFSFMTAGSMWSREQKCESSNSVEPGDAALRASQEPLKVAFDAGDVQPWEPRNFKLVRKIQDAPRNHGQVLHMIDTITCKEVAVKQIPNSWIRQHPEDFDQQLYGEGEHPWVGIGCAALLTNANYQYACPLLGVYRDEQTTHIVMELAHEGDLFSWCHSPHVSVPGPERETLVRPLARQIIQSLQQLHDLSIVHGDVSLENIVLSGPLQIQLIDFGKSSTSRFFRSGIRNKSSYAAPEMHTGEEFDGFLSDAFAAGVTLYALLCNEYPWLSTRPVCCKTFDYFCKNGFRAFIKKRRLRSGAYVEESMSEPVVELLAGLLDPDPASRLTLGESAWAESGRRSVAGSSWLDVAAAPESGEFDTSTTDASAAGAMEA
eukprot:CAMPEP_0177314500 /NCGR_PEP_ID=MMETSP0368-20130122/11963_1 /TAXON_ID=447022 ORGANISM="Scrippsiella hangoei-like, Strain SHHI-4" /NCGR_SAMPLE_ID=MMETSP0368 /ASSEMBLY_ACC=CAM_ASM_000363 /LENGTH=383 /DNA_ID=CAMNT_0018773645 /DNA_START=76 /DNA_END=1227 /DNA_ORIENTATION=-